MRNFEREIKKANELAQQYLDANPHLSLAQYRLASVIESFATQFHYVDDFMFAKIRDETILGHSLSDELGTTIMLNDILDYKNSDPRTGFTGAHELGHVVLGHTQETFTTTKSISSAEVNEFEVRANVFAGNLVLPFNVFKAQISEFYHSRQIAAVSKVSLKVIEIRVREILQRRFLMASNQVDIITEEYMSATDKYSVSQTTFFELMTSYSKVMMQIKLPFWSYTRVAPAFKNVAIHIFQRHYNINKNSNLSYS